MTSPDPDVMTKAMNRYDKAMQDFEKAGGYARNRRRPQWPPASAYPRRSWANNSARSPADTPRIELARILFSDADTLILDEPTNHLDADSILWLREFLKKYEADSS